MTSPAGEALTWTVAGLLAEGPGASREFDLEAATVALDAD